MKKLIYTLLLGALATSVSSCMKIDNWKEPDARLYGRVIDKDTGEPIPTDQDHYKIRIWEISYKANVAEQNIPVKQDGSFNNHKLFAGTYKIYPVGAWWPRDTIYDVKVGRKGHEEVIEVIPYLRLTDFKADLSTEKNANKYYELSMECLIESPVAGVPDIEDVTPFVSLNHFCGDGQKIDLLSSKEYRFVSNKSWSSLKKNEEGKAVIPQPGVVSKKIELKPGYTYFVRLGAKVKSEGEKKYNYSEIKTIVVPQ